MPDYLKCPYCDQREQVSEVDPDASLSEIDSHVRIAHDVLPSALRDIELVSGD